jgi:hypothetical protein
MATDLEQAFLETEITVPLIHGALTDVRGILDEEGTLRPMLGTHVQTLQKTLYVRAGALPTLKRDDQITIGALGAASAVGGEVHLVNDFRKIDDGAIIAIALSGGVP